MITKQQFEQAAVDVRSNITTYLPKMIAYKSHIQSAVLDISTQKELEDVRDCRINQGLISKLVGLAKSEWKKSKDAVSLYCAAMAVGTIIKEYEWGTQFVVGDGLFQMAQRIESETI